MPRSPPPVPILARYTLPAGPVTVTFDRPLNPNPALDTANWFVRHNGISQVILGAVAFANRVVITLGLGPGNPGPNVVSFSPPPFDVQAAAVPHVPAAAFADFPLT